MFQKNLTLMLFMVAGILAHNTSVSCANPQPFAGVTGLTATAVSKTEIRLSFDSDLPVSYRLKRPKQDVIKLELINARLLSDLFNGNQCTLVKNDAMNRQVCLSAEASENPVFIIVDRSLLQTMVTVDGAVMSLDSKFEPPVQAVSIDDVTAISQASQAFNPLESPQGDTVANPQYSVIPETAAQQAFPYQNGAIHYQISGLETAPDIVEPPAYVAQPLNSTHATPQLSSQKSVSSDETISTVAILDEPMTAEDKLAKAQSLYLTGKEESAIALLKKNDGDELAFINQKALLAEIYIDQQQYQQASSIYESIFKVKPDPEVVRIIAPRYATALFLQPEATYSQHIPQLQSVLKNYSFALAEDDWVHFVLGAFYQASGKNRFALPLLRQASFINPDSVDIQYRLGLSYEALGDTARARSHFEKGLKLSPNSEALKIAMARLSK